MKYVAGYHKKNAGGNLLFYWPKTVRGI